MLTLTVSPGGSDGFSSVQAAVDAVPEGRKATVFIRRGVYRERVVVNKSGLKLVGEDPEETVITWSAKAKDPGPDGREKGTFLSFTVLAAAPDLVFESLTIRNDAGDGRIAGQAVALYAAGDRGVYRNCRLIACQDTLFCGPLMDKVLREISPRTADGASVVDSVGDCPVTRERQYFENCVIRGDIDFIFGPYRCWFEGCRHIMNARGGWYTAPNTPEGQPWGLVFRRCALTGDCGEGEAYLGRPWRKHGSAVFIGCETDSAVSPLGFADWDEGRPVTARLMEGLTRGARADLKTRHPKQRLLTAEEAALITPEAVLDGWCPFIS